MTSLSKAAFCQRQLSKCGMKGHEASEKSSAKDNLSIVELHLVQVTGVEVQGSDKIGSCFDRTKECLGRSQRREKDFVGLAEAETRTSPLSGPFFLLSPHLHPTHNMTHPRSITT